jgi:hypothetical protein
MAAASLIQGRLATGGGRAEADELLQRYEAEGRSVWIQELNLLPDQRETLTRVLERDRGVGAPYDFFAANCTTPLRDALDTALGGRLREVAGQKSRVTFRERVAGYTASDPLLSTLVDFLMSDSGDRPISVWEDMSLPGSLRDHLRDVTVPDSVGHFRPLVRRETVRPGFLPDQDPAPRPHTWSASLTVGLALGAILAWLGAASTEGRAIRYCFAALGGAWTLGVGLGGTVLAALWAFSDQTAMLGNENLFQANPLFLLLGVVTWGSARDPRWTRALAVATAGIAVVGLLLKVAPAFDQTNGAIIGLTLPTHLGLAWGILCSAHSPAK